VRSSGDIEGTRETSESVWVGRASDGLRKAHASYSFGSTPALSGIANLDRRALIAPGAAAGEEYGTRSILPHLIRTPPPVLFVGTHISRPIRNQILKVANHGGIHPWLKAISRQPIGYDARADGLRVRFGGTSSVRGFVAKVYREKRLPNEHGSR
jgi:hypothetical protein